ncbi:MAG: DUF1926 domain-containing protein [Bacteroidota bacterium]|nr:DUF1926 domain-containing protein [Bacteroidota bacterium]MDP4233691.1 DUF1926 domain-containing protein [Bacteroidota bacterium]MDP4241852.1 DUF1926 domain-containing protein [Bacteroidota bacterium]MDP4288401.1 DUF1926 domain-containing protein [Bacteroidota bacterium]
MVIFTFTTHNHQPLGNFDHVFEEAFEKSYRPFFELAARYPIRFATHFTGILLNWISAKHPEHIKRLRAMVASGQMEIISGGFFEPILSVIPANDQQKQITLLSQRIRHLFGTEPRGMWLAERVWEQPLASALHDAGMRYVLLDDTHFLHAGLREEDLNGYYLTEDLGKTLAVFPISKALRYTIPFAAVDETIRVLRDASSENDTNVVSFADDGEKFGVWPRTYDHVYGSGEHAGWLEELFRKLDENSDWIRMMHPGEVIDALPPRGRVYLPNASYAEMNEWSLPTARRTHEHEDFVHSLHHEKRWDHVMPFVRGGYWRTFLAKYPEVNHLHKHMLRTSERCAAVRALGLDIAEAEHELLASQCNDPYWHGVFGGAYLPNLRHANYSALVRADRLLDEAEQLSGVRMESRDIDCDGADEIVLESRELSLYVKPSLGGMIAEIDFKPRQFHAMNVISRREEAYHRKLTEVARQPHEEGTKSIHDMVESKEPGLEKLLIYDAYRRGSLIEHFFAPGMTAEALRTNQHQELGDFVTSGFESNYAGDVLSLSRSGTVDQHSVHMVKTLALQDGQIIVTYRLTNESPEPVRLCFASEWAFNLLAPTAPDRYFESNGVRLAEPQMNSSGSTQGGHLRLVDEYLRLAIALHAPSASQIIRFPIETVSTSESGFERIFQGSILMPIWTIDLPGNKKWKAEMTVGFESL